MPVKVRPISREILRDLVLGVPESVVEAMIEYRCGIRFVGFLWVHYVGDSVIVLRGMIRPRQLKA